MKTHRFSIGIISALLAASLVTSARADPSPPGLASPQSALSSAFTYRGQLKSGGTPINATCNIAFRLYDASSGGFQFGGTLTQTVTVTASLFTVELNFGAGAFAGSARWLDLAVRCPAGVGAFTALSPRQEVTAVPYALYSAAPWVTSGSNLSYGGGNVGLGVANPIEQLQLTGNLGLTSTTATAGIIKSGSDTLLHTFGCSGNLFVGLNAGNLTAAPTACNNTGVGGWALVSTTTGDGNTASGRSALASNDAGDGNTASGAGALQLNTVGSYNTANGLGALSANIMGNYNTASGFNALESNVQGDSNTASGMNALRANIGGLFNAAFGQGALESNVWGVQNAAFGMNALQVTTSSYNAAIGESALVSDTTGGGNTAVGFAAGGVIIGGSYNTFLGYNTKAASAELNNASAIGANATVAVSNALILGSIGGPTVNVGIGLNNPTFQLQLSTNSAAKPTSNVWTIVSDARLKENIAPFTDGLSTLKGINPVSYTLNGKANLPKGSAGISVIAQDARSVIPYSISTFKAKLNPEDSQDTELYAFDSSALTFVTINAVKELSARLDHLEQAADRRDAQIAALQSTNMGLEARLAALEKKANAGAAPESSSSTTPWPLFGGLALVGLVFVNRRRLP